MNVTIDVLVKSFEDMAAKYNTVLSDEFLNELAWNVKNLTGVALKAGDM
jgi:hypothetical protein